MPGGRVRLAPGRAQAVVDWVDAGAPVDGFVATALLETALIHALAMGGCVVNHAAALQVGGVELLVVGPSRAGKSTLSAAVLAAERGWRFPDGASNAGKIAVAVEDLSDRLFARLRGEWAVLIWDRREQTLLAARDLIGCRPLFMHQHGARLFLATEIRQVMAGSGVEAPLTNGMEIGFPSCLAARRDRGGHHAGGPSVVAATGVGDAHGFGAQT